MSIDTTLHDGLVLGLVTGSNEIPGNVDDVPVVVDFGDRIVTSARITAQLRAVEHAANVSEWWMQLAEESPQSWFTIYRREMPTSLTGTPSPWVVPFTNQFWREDLKTPPATGPVYVPFMRVVLAVGRSGFDPGELDMLITLTDDQDVTVQTFPTPTTGANSYVSVLDALLRLSEMSPNLVSFALLGPDRQAEILVEGTKRIELEARCFLTGSSKITDTQVLEFGRENAYSAAGPLITTVLQSWIDGILLYVDETAEAELLGEEAEEPQEDAGITEIELDAKGAQFREKRDPKSAITFFQQRRKIFAKLAESFPRGLSS